MQAQEEAYHKLMTSNLPKDEVIAGIRRLRDSSHSMNLKVRFERALKEVEEE